MIFLIKSNNDKKSFEVAKSLGMNVVELEKNEDIDEVIKRLIDKKSTKIVLSNEIAGFSEDIIKKYKNNKEVIIYIAPSKRNM